MATNKTNTEKLRFLVKEACQIHYDKLLARSAELTDDAYYQLYQQIYNDIIQNHQNSDRVKVQQYIFQYFYKLKKALGLPIPLPNLYIKPKREKNSIESEDIMAKIRESSLMGKWLQQAWRENLHQMSPAQAFAALYASLWIYSGVQDEQLWRQIYQYIIDKKPLLRLGNALILTVEIPSKSYGYHPRFSTSMLEDVAENADALLFITRHIVIDDVSLMWIAYINRHLQGKMPTFEQTQEAFDQLMQTCLQIDRPKPHHFSTIQKGLYLARQTFKNSQLDMQMSAIVSDQQKHTSIGSDQWNKYHSPSFKPLILALSDELFTTTSPIKKGKAEPIDKPAVYKSDLVREIRNILNQTNTTAIESLKGIASQTQISAQLGLIYWISDLLNGVNSAGIKRHKSTSAQRYLSEVGDWFLHFVQDQDITTWDTDDFINLYENIIYHSNKKKIGYTATVLRSLHQSLQRHFVDIPGVAIASKSDGMVVEPVLVAPIMYQHIRNLIHSSTLSEHNQKILDIIFILLYRTGMRINELLGLKLRDFEYDYKQEQTVILNILVRPNGYRSIKSDDGRRRFCLQALLKPSELQLVHEWYLLRKQRNETYFLTLEHKSSALEYHEIQKPISVILDTLPYKVTPHGFRHNAISVMAMILGGADALLPYFSDYSSDEILAIKRKFLGECHQISTTAWSVLAEFAGHSSPETTFSSYIHVADLIAYSQMAHTTIEMPATLVEALTGLRRQSFSDNGRRAYDKDSGMVNLNDIRTLIIKQLDANCYHRPARVTLPAIKITSHKAPSKNQMPDILRIDVHAAVMKFLESLQDNYSFEYAKSEGLDSIKAEKIKSYIDTHRKQLTSYFGDKGKKNPNQYLPIEPKIKQEITLLHNLLKKLGDLYQEDRKAFDDFVVILRSASFVSGQMRMPFKDRAQVYRFAQIAVKLLDKKYWQIEVAARSDVKKSINLNQELAQLKQETTIVAKKSTRANSSYTGFLISHTCGSAKNKHNGVSILQHVCFLLVVGIDAC